jgi:hypothetical protein
MSGEEPGRAERELEDLLRRVPPEAPDPVRGARARRAFLAGGAEARSRGSGALRTGRVMAQDAAAGEEDAFAAWLAARAPAAPRPEVVRRARLAFLTAVAAAAPPLRARRSFRRSVWVAAAAAILAVTFLLPRPERWNVQLDGRLTFDGSEYMPGDEARLAAALERSGTVETALGRARFDLGRELVVELQPASALAFPFLTELDGVAPLELALARGETFLRTTASYPGNPIVVRTALADVALHGTTVGVRVDELGTCVCVADGKARVTSGRLAGGSQEVAARFTLRVFPDPGRQPSLEAFPPDDSGVEAAHTMELVAFQRGD